MDIKINIPQNAKILIDILQSNGHSAYVVGGCVRDSILGRKPHDWDICTSATPDEMLKIFNDKKVIETGLQHGTITVICDGEPYEITTFRIDGDYSDNRRPDNVTFTDSLIEDLKRRDFTINAMAYNSKTGLVDPFNGLEDIKYRKIDCVGSAKERFEEDALRILRAIRFAAQLDFTILPGTDWEIKRQYKCLEKISVERINSEFCKIVSSDSFCVQLLLYKYVFLEFIPELKSMCNFPQNNPYHIYDVFDHTVHALEESGKSGTDDLIIKLAILFHDIGKPHSYQDGEDGVRHFKGHGRVSADITDSILKRMRFDNDTRNNVVELVYYHDATFEVGKKYVKRWLNKIGEVQFRRLLEVRKADIVAQNLIYKSSRLEKVNSLKILLDEVLQEDECFSMKDLAVNGNDVKTALLLEEGKDVGYWLNTILDRVIEGKLENNKEKIIYWLVGVADGWLMY